MVMTVRYLLTHFSVDYSSFSVITKSTSCSSSINANMGLSIGLACAAFICSFK